MQFIKNKYDFIKNNIIKYNLKNNYIKKHIEKKSQLNTLLKI
jgi:hypothetical protein